MRHRVFHACIAGLAAAAASGCGAGAEGAEGPCPVGVGDGSWLVDEPEVAVRVTGSVLTPGPPPEGPPDYDGALPVRGPQGQVAGAVVTLMDAGGTALSEDVTDCDGRFALPAPAHTSTLFVHVEPVPGADGRDAYTGYVRARATEASEVDAGRMHLLEVDELRWRLETLGERYDPDKGWIVQSFTSPRTEGGGLVGGQGLRVRGTESGPSFAVTGTRTIATDRLPPGCGPGEADVPRGEPKRGPDGDILCYTDLLEMIFVPNVVPATGVELELLQPSGLACAQRQPVDRWLVMPGSVSRVRADCR